MNIYYKNEQAELSGDDPVVGSSLYNIYDPMLELTAIFSKNNIKITGDYGINSVLVDSLCIGYTNAFRYELTTQEGSCSGLINDKITIFNFDEILFINGFKLILESTENLYLGYLFLGCKTLLPRFEAGPETGKILFSESSRSFGGQVFGVRRKTLNSFSASFPRISTEEKKIITEYVDAVLNIEPHIIDPYPDAREEFPPMYSTLNVSDVSLPKRNENGFYYSSSLSWQEAR
ncbi:MAG: hypothetical protein FWD26_04970 [Treponema sp.]|nr:hypothetical protein [Treponema sp.]